MLSNYTRGDFRTLSLVYAVLVLAVSFAQVPVGPPTLNLDKLLHAGLYFGFAFTLWRGFSNKKLLLAAFFLGLLIEFIQPTFGRNFDYFDMAANGMGILLYYKFFSAA